MTATEWQQHSVRGFLLAKTKLSQLLPRDQASPYLFETIYYSWRKLISIGDANHDGFRRSPILSNTLSVYQQTAIDRHLDLRCVLTLNEVNDAPQLIFHDDVCTTISTSFSQVCI